MANVTHKVVWGDTLSELAVKYNTTVANLVKLNNIKNPDYIVVGQVLIISGEAATEKKNTTNQPVIKVFGLQSGTDRTVYATWSWDQQYTKEYSVKWTYDTGDGVWFEGRTAAVTDKQDIYNAPSNAIRVRFKVRPIAKTRKVNGKDTPWFTANWSVTKGYSFNDNPPSTPPVPTVKLELYKLTVSLDNLDVNATHIRFQVYKDNNTSPAYQHSERIVTSAVSYTFNVMPGGVYKVRCRAERGDMYSEWSAYSSSAGTIPSVPESITTCKAASETSIYLEWGAVSSAKSYDIEYSTNKSYFDGSDGTSTVSNIEFNHYEKTQLESGKTYFFRVRAVNDEGHSDWTELASVILGKAPVAPTTWSNTSRVMTGEDLILYWTHNAEDGSDQTLAEIEIYKDGIKELHPVEKDDNGEVISSFKIETSSYVEGTVVLWRVRTAGITKELGEWSTQRVVNVYAPPTVELHVTDVNGNDVETLTSFPIYISALAGPKTQRPIGYSVAIIANEGYETIDHVGNDKYVNQNDEVYLKYYDINDPLTVELSANHVDLENNIPYIVKVVASMDSGLSGEATRDFTVAWTDESYAPNAELMVDTDTVVTHIKPYCKDLEDHYIADVVMSVYRHEYDGSFTEIATGVVNGSETFVTDPHPALDFARYRIVATSTVTGAVSYTDLAPYPIGEKGVVVQWDEQWKDFSITSEDELEQPMWSGSMLKLPYNIDVSSNHKQDVALIEYIGRVNPVSYYGTQISETATWNVVIDKKDTNTLYMLRRLAKWMGNVYVREPSGSGYHAHVTVSFNQKHRDTTIPVTLDITRVEGGV
jgi:hypothetical protein